MQKRRTMGMINNELLQQGIDLITRGDHEKASVLLAQVVKENPESEQGWLWLGRCRTSPNEKRHCFNRVLSINPNNKDAQYELTSLAELEKVRLQSTHSPTSAPASEPSNPSLMPATDVSAKPF